MVWRDPSWLVCLMLPIYMLHQFEEHGIDAFGARYHFINDLCTTLGHPSLADCPANPAFVLAVNVGGGVWIPGLLATSGTAGTSWSARARWASRL
jgi:hypothetical protein